MANTTRFPGSVPPPPGGGGQPQKKSTAIRKAPVAAAAPAKAGTRRMPRAGGGRDQEDTGRARYDQQQQGQGQEQSKTNLYIGIGVGALVLIVVAAVMMSGGDSEGGGGSGGTSWVSKQLGKAVAAKERGDYRKALEFCEQVLGNASARKSPRYKEVEILAREMREYVNAEPTAAAKLAEFKRKLEAAKADGTAMKRSTELLNEAKQLVAQYRMTSSGEELVGLRDGIQRWANTEASADWLKDYNPNKTRIENKYLSVGDYAGAVKEWNQFREVSNASDLKSRVDSEIVTINIASQSAAEKVLAEAGTGADARAKIEEAQPRFMGTDGGTTLKRALTTLK